MKTTIEQQNAAIVKTHVQKAAQHAMNQVEQLATTLRHIRECKDLIGGAAVIDSVVALRLETAQTSVNVLRDCIERLQEEIR